MLENEGILLENALSIIRSGQPPNEEMELYGRLHCRSGVTIHVEVIFSIYFTRRRLYLQARSYNYHAWLSTTGQPLIRYDMSHEWLGLHRHLYDLATGGASVAPVTFDELPTLDAFVRTADSMARNAPP